MHHTVALYYSILLATGPQLYLATILSRNRPSGPTASVWQHTKLLSTVFWPIVKRATDVPIYARQAPYSFIRAWLCAMSMDSLYSVCLISYFSILLCFFQRFTHIYIRFTHIYMCPYIYVQASYSFRAWLCGSCYRLYSAIVLSYKYQIYVVFGTFDFLFFPHLCVNPLHIP